MIGTFSSRKLIYVALFVGLGSLQCSPDSSITSGASDAGSSGVSIAVTKIYPTASGSGWTTVSSGGRIYIKGLDVTIKGTCSTGVARIGVNEGGSDYSETATCTSLGEFTWNKTYTSTTGEGDKTLNIIAYSSGGTNLASTTATVRVDNTAPSAPSISSPSIVTSGASGSYTNTGFSSTQTISGTAPADAISLVGPNNTTITVTGGNWSYNATLTEGSTVNFSFYTVDQAGNQSSATTLQIAWNPSMYLNIAACMPGDSQVADSGTSFSLETALGAPGYVTDSGTSFLMETGLNFMVNQRRADSN